MKWKNRLAFSQSRTGRRIVAALVCGISMAVFLWVAGMGYDFHRGLCTFRQRDGALNGYGIYRQDGCPTLCWATWRADGSIHNSGLARFKDWNSLWATSDAIDATYLEETEFHLNGTRKAFGTQHRENGESRAEVWTWHSNGAKSSHFTTRNENIHGVMHLWYHSGQMKLEMPMRNRRRHGRHRWFDRSGELLAQCVCKDDKVISGDFIRWYGDAGWDGDILFGPTDGGEHVIKTRTSHHEGKLIKEQIWNRHGELVGQGYCRDGENWDGVFSETAVDSKSNKLTDLSIWQRGTEIARFPFDPAADLDEVNALVEGVRGSPDEPSAEPDSNSSNEATPQKQTRTQ